MSRPKRIFIVLSIIFLAILFYASYDISTRTTFPGSKPKLKDRIQEDFLDKDSVIKGADTTNIKKL